MQDGIVCNCFRSKTIQTHHPLRLRDTYDSYEVLLGSAAKAVYTLASAIHLYHAQTLVHLATRR